MRLQDEERGPAPWSLEHGLETAKHLNHGIVPRRDERRRTSAHAWAGESLSSLSSFFKVVLVPG